MKNMLSQMQFNKRKKKLLKLLEKDFSEHSALSYLLIRTGKLDNVIKKMNNEITIPNATCLVKKGYLSSEEQFIDVLYHVIRRINVNFWFLTEKNTIIEAILNFDETLPLLLNKNYVGNNDFIPFYNYHTEKACVCNFYKILKFIDRSILIDNFLKDNKINIDKFNLNSEKDVEKLFNLLRLICICNCNSYHLFYIFSDNMNERNKNMYKTQIEILIERTLERKKNGKIILNSYTY